METPYWDKKHHHFQTAHKKPVFIGAQTFNISPNFYNNANQEQQAFVAMNPQGIDDEESAPNTDTIVYYPGWGETSPQFETATLSPFVEHLQEETRGRIGYVGLNLLGKGTKAYAKRKDHSKVSFEDHLKSAAETTDLLAARGKIEGNVHLVGHSMGALDTIAGWQALTSILSQFRGRVASVNLLAPTTDEPFALTDLEFLWQVRSKLPATALQLLSGWNGSLDVNAEEYKQIMGGGADSHAYTVPDSAQRFFGQTLNPRRRFDQFIQNSPETTVRVVRFANDPLIPKSAPPNLAAYLKQRNPALDVKSLTLEKFPSHLLPITMTEVQKAEVRNMLSI